MLTVTSDGFVIVQHSSWKTLTSSAVAVGSSTCPCADEQGAATGAGGRAPAHRLPHPNAFGRRQAERHVPSVTEGGIEAVFCAAIAEGRVAVALGPPDVVLGAAARHASARVVSSEVVGAIDVVVNDEREIVLVVAGAADPCRAVEGAALALLELAACLVPILSPLVVRRDGYAEPPEIRADAHLLAPIIRRVSVHLVSRKVRLPNRHVTPTLILDENARHGSVGTVVEGVPAVILTLLRVER